MLLCCRKVTEALRARQRDLTVRQAANVAFCVATMCFDAEHHADKSLEELNEVTMQSILRHSQYFQDAVQESYASSTQGANNSARTVSKYADLRQVHMFAQYLITVQTAEDARKVPDFLLSALANSNGDEGWSYGASKLQRSIVAGLKEAMASSLGVHSYDIQEEYSCFGGMMPVDIAVLRRGGVAALIEVDGPHHERSNGLLRRTDLFKQYIYCKKYPNSIFHRISYKDNTELGTAVLSKGVVDLLQARDREYRDREYSSNKTRQSLLKGVLQSLQEIGSWGIRIARAALPGGANKK